MATVRQRIAVRFSVWNRRRKAVFVARFMNAHKVRSVLLVGPSGAWKDSPRRHVVETAAARLADFCVAADVYKRIKGPWIYVCCDGLQLPFRDQSFDLVLSNAVIEHVGGEDHQVQFISEHARVGKAWILTTPNRWFPVESHTRVVLRHWSPSWRLKHTGKGHGKFTRLLGRRELHRLLPAGARLRGRWFSPTFTVASRRG